MIEVRDLTKTFGAVEAVRGISFRVEAGEIVGFLGPNGAGKTTTMRILAGIFPPTSGEVRIAGRDPARDPLACRRAVGYFPEYAPFYPDLRVAGYLRFVARMKRLPRAERAGAVAQVLAWCGLEGVAGRRVGTLSKGYRQRVGLAQALCGNPPILILDEPTIGLDPEQVVEIRDLVRALGGSRTVFFSSHILSEVEALCERVIVVARGRLVGEGTARELSERVGRRQRVVLRVDGPAEAVATALAALPGVERVAREAAAFVLEAAASADVARAAGEAMAARGWTIRELREEMPDLEQIFLRLVRDGARPQA
ncbi:MAG: ABC transporter ATP-binding protein [Deltaproteobacteria bacterium]|nr:MAG: ABC transporter ATP-binding protein [Deltaproteobacteria bacterium]